MANYMLPLDQPSWVLVFVVFVCIQVAFGLLLCDLFMGCLGMQ